MKRFAIAVSLLLIALMVAGCTGTEKGAGVGAIAGGVIGGVIGHQSGHGAEGALIGAAVGGVSGAAVGNAQDKQAAATEDQIIMACPGCGIGVDVTGYAPGTQVRCPECNTIFTVQ